MSDKYFISDLHLCHDREFIYIPRGFDNIEDMNNAILINWNNIVIQEDDVYVAGDLMLNDNKKGMEILRELNGNLHIILGNHDTNNRIELYKQLPNVKEVCFATRIKEWGCSIYISHYPTLVGNLDESQFFLHMFNFFGHTHSKSKFYLDNPWMYNIAVDAHDCCPVSLEEAIKDCREKYDECAKML